MNHLSHFSVTQFEHHTLSACVKSNVLKSMTAKIENHVALFWKDTHRICTATTKFELHFENLLAVTIPPPIETYKTKQNVCAWACFKGGEGGSETRRLGCRITIKAFEDLQRKGFLKS